MGSRPGDAHHIPECERRLTNNLARSLREGALRPTKVEANLTVWPMRQVPLILASKLMEKLQANSFHNAPIQTSYLGSGGGHSTPVGRSSPQAPYLMAFPSPTGIGAGATALYAPPSLIDDENSLSIDQMIDYSTLPTTPASYLSRYPDVDSQPKPSYGQPAPSHDLFQSQPGAGQSTSLGSTTVNMGDIPFEFTGVPTLKSERNSSFGPSGQFTAQPDDGTETQRQTELIPLHQDLYHGGSLDS
jgi:hypothetical protein